MNKRVEQIKSILIANIVPIVFLAVSIIGIKYSGVRLPIIMSDVVSRFDRNAFLVLSLLIPILAGMGLNFGIVLGAMAGQVALFIVVVMGLDGLPGFAAAAILTIPFAILFGWLTGKLLNRTKGQEMITGLILGFFAMGVYQFVFLFFLGGVMPINKPGIILSSGVGVRNTIDLKSMKYALDNIIKTDMFTFMLGCAAVWLVVVLVKMFIKKEGLTKPNRNSLIWIAVLAVGGIAGYTMPAFAQYKLIVKIPVVSFALIFLLCLFIKFLFGTKLGQNMRAVGQNMDVAQTAGIDVDKTRIIATIISTLLAGWGQIIFLQNLGNFSTYNAHENVGMFSAAALLIGGASVNKATVPQAIMGTILFHLLFNVSPMAGKNMFGSPEIGEYFRVFIAYGIIAITLALYAWKQVMQAARKAKLDEEA